MHAPIEDYALIGDCHGAALVCRNGSIDWLCVPRFDSEPCFAALLGDESNGRWLICPKAPIRQTHRKYRDNTLSLETEFETDEGTVRIVDSMPIESDYVDLVRLVEGVRGCVTMRLDLIIRFGFGKIVPWVTQRNDELQAIAGPDMLHLRTPIELHGEDMRTRSEFRVEAGQRIPFVLTHHASHLHEFERIEPFEAVEKTEARWQNWAARADYAGPHEAAVTRSLITLKALAYMPTGGLIAAPTTSLPESIGGSRNWDYRFCWLRDATITLSTLIDAGYDAEARAWREWLLRAIAGEPSAVQVMYGIDGRRDLGEKSLTWLGGYEGSRPVRVGNDAHTQVQHDTYGELMNAMHHCRVRGFENAESWALERALLEHLEGQWHRPDQGIWEARGKPRHYVHSKIMAWVAFDRAVRAVRDFGREGPQERWAKLRDAIFEEVCARGYNEEIGAFTQSYGSNVVDASLLMMVPVGFLPATDRRVIGTVRRIQQELSEGDLVRRYAPNAETEGLVGGEGCFIACCFWLVDNLEMQGKHEEAERLFERLLSLRNDVGLLAEEYDVRRQRLVGNFPQALSHLALINSARRLGGEYGQVGKQAMAGGARMAVRR